VVWPLQAKVDPKPIGCCCQEMVVIALNTKLPVPHEDGGGILMLGAPCEIHGASRHYLTLMESRRVQVRQGPMGKVDLIGSPWDGGCGHPSVEPGGLICRRKNVS